MNPKAEELKKRTAAFADGIARLVRDLPNTLEGRRVGGQLFDAGTSVASNYRAACRARSHAEFVATIGLVVEESDECTFWLAFLSRNQIMSESAIRSLLEEAEELLAIFAASHRTASGKSQKRSR
ncbi:MAG TPA: four helix bundle protein [Vicinamibacterales bacterium]|nr:four helix bundle protein [Vicinamibacterales bacterium]